jgi:N-acetylmuramoyl-L-alanine amidase
MHKINFFVKNITKGEICHMKKIFILCLVLIILTAFIANVCYVSFATSKYGSTGDEVKKIQTKLKNWGYYSGSVDGIYGSKTVSAVKSFQKKNGLTVDGIAGPKTLAAMGITSSSSSSSSSNNSDLNLLSKLVYGEARGEIYKGQVAVAATVLNRVASSSFPNTIAGVIYQSGAFTAVSDGQINLTPDSTAKKAAQDAINGWDPTSGCIYYFNPSTATSKWIWSRPQVITIGKHIFCK